MRDTKATCRWLVNPELSAYELSRETFPASELDDDQTVLCSSYVCTFVAGRRHRREIGHCEHTKIVINTVKFDSLAKRSCMKEKNSYEAKTYKLLGEKFHACQSDNDHSSVCTSCISISLYKKSYEI